MNPGPSKGILATLDSCCEAFTFPMLDNGYIYLAGCRLSLHRSSSDWALVIEIFGFSPRAGIPDLHVYTFSSRLHERDPTEKYVTEEAYRRYLDNNPHNESRFFYPVDDLCQDPEGGETLDVKATHVTLRNQSVSLPPADEYAIHDISLTAAPRVRVYELCRYLAATRRELILATPAERAVSVLPEMRQMLQLEHWRHPDLLGGERPSSSPAFRMLADVLVTGDCALYRPTEPSNTHWSNWPEGGTL